MTVDLILGTAGHIDHGKTSLVKALTGVDTDRLPEEKKRGITIELGFAELTLGDVRLGIVDVPGHERFVRNMLAGATGIDLALLVVAADDSVKPQTREHLEILRLLDLEVGVVALTKCDVAEPDWIDLVETEVRELLADTFLADAPIIRTSAHQGVGLDEVRQALVEAAAQVVAKAEQRRTTGPFRMAIDRTFTIAGHGTVVTGSVASGQTQVGDALVIEPGGIEVRVRGVQNHDRQAEEVHRGQRAAINLAGVHHDATRRGQELASPGHLIPSRRLTAQIHLLNSAPRPLKHRGRVRLHVGTAELMTSVNLVGTNELAPGESAMAQLYLTEPAVTTWNQPLVIRSESPVVTIGGGVVLDPVAEKIRRNDTEAIQWLERLAEGDPLRRAGAAAYFVGWRDWQPEELARSAGIQDFDDVARQLVESGELIDIQVSPTRSQRVHAAVVERLCGQIEKVLGRLHQQYPLQRVIDRTPLVQEFRYLGAPALLEAALTRMAEAGRIKQSAAGVTLAGHGPQLSGNEQKLLDRMLEDFRQAGCQPPSVAEIQKQTTKNQASVPGLVKLAASEGELVEIDSTYYLHREAETQLRQQLTEHFAGGKGLTLSEIRELLGTTRKYAVPICEYLDRVGFTRREGDLRFLNQPAEVEAE